MSIPSLFRTRARRKNDAVPASRRARASRLRNTAKLTFLARRFQRKRKTRSSYLNTGHLNDHVRKDIGLQHFDLTTPD